MTIPLFADVPLVIVYPIPVGLAVVLLVLAALGLVAAGTGETIAYRRRHPPRRYAMPVVQVLPVPHDNGRHP